MRWLSPAVPEGATEGQVAIRRVCCQRFGPVGSLQFPRGLLFMALPMAWMAPAFQAVPCWSLGVCVWPSGVVCEGH